MLEQPQTSFKNHLRKRIISKYQFSDNNLFFYLHLNFRYTIQYVHDSKAPTEHLGGCSPQKGLTLRKGSRLDIHASE